MRFSSASLFENSLFFERLHATILNMKRWFFSAFLVLLAAVFFPFLPAHAQRALDSSRLYEIDDIQTEGYLATPRFEGMARAALINRPANFNFTIFRRYYAQSRQYDPFSEETIDRMLTLAYDIQNTSVDAPEYQDLIDSYQRLFLDHMANLGVILNMAALSRSDPRLGDSEFLDWMKEGLVKDLMKSGDGYTLRGAYDVITLDEERVLLERLNLMPLTTEAVREYDTWYNMHEVSELSGGERTVFVNTTWPMRYLNKIAEFESR